jgi:methylated-DNA-[protein]-cysteine S-methyltransferase
MNTDHDPLLAGLADLAVSAPGGLLDRIAARWIQVPAAAGDVYVAFSERGVAFLRTTESAGSAEEFARSFRIKFGRPLLAAERPPAGLLPALRTGRAGKLPLDLGGLTAFQEAVLRATMTIPRGETRPYGWVARRAGRPRAVRAAASALAGNPVPLLIPCHRVVQADGTAGDYVFGAARKEALLSAEGANLDEVHDLATAGVRYIASDTTGIVCLPSCRNARRITPVHRHAFATLAEAGAAGYRPCQHCRPAA